jgi:hypothetical protein
MKERMAGFLMAICFAGWIFYPVAWRYAREQIVAACATYQAQGYERLCDYVK